MQIANDTQAKAQAENALSGLPPIPDGFASSEVYLRELDSQEAKLNGVKAKLEGVSGELRGMPDSPTELSITELQDEVYSKRQEFERVLAQGESLKRIRDTVQRIATTRSIAGPLQELPTQVSKYFAKLTNGAYTDIAMIDKVPTTASGTTLKDFDVQRLSQGTKTSLALATRLALADAYLADRPGVIMLDDPCVDMDPARREAAMSLLHHIATTHQVILFTCN
jgi:uncharacterized protein YhaN